MARPTAQDVIDMARHTLNDRDASSLRDSDEDLLVFVNDALDRMFDLRPDLFIGSMALAFVDDGHALALDDEIPVPGRYRGLLADYVIFRADSKDDEHANSGRAAAFLKLFEDRLK